MNRSIAFALCLCLAWPQSVIPQESESTIPVWVYCVASGAAIAAGVLHYINHTKTAKAATEPSLREKALAEIYYLSTPEQRKQLAELKSDDEIHSFMERFWKEKDPNPATPENELEEEHSRRLEYSNLHFKEGAKAGWQTDRGRVYVVYGPPDQIEYFPWTGFGLRSDFNGAHVTDPYDGGSIVRSLEIWLYNRPASGNKCQPCLIIIMQAWPSSSLLISPTAGSLIRFTRLRAEKTLIPEYECRQWSEIRK